MKTVGALLAEYGKTVRVNNYVNKDVDKFMHCNKLISRGVGSSGKYAEVCADIANTGSYEASDIVAVSVNGNRKGRVGVDREELVRAIRAKATIITDNELHRQRQYNIGEREVSTLLSTFDYHEVPLNSGIWEPKS